MTPTARGRESRHRRLRPTARLWRRSVGGPIDAGSRFRETCIPGGAPRPRREDARLLLRHGNLHPVSAEDAPDGAVDVRAHVVDAIHRIGDPETDLEPHAVVLEADEARDRGWIVQD